MDISNIGLSKSARVNTVVASVIRAIKGIIVNGVVAHDFPVGKIRTVRRKNTSGIVFDVITTDGKLVKINWLQTEINVRRDVLAFCEKHA